MDVLNCTSHFIGAISLSNIFQVNQSRHHHLTLCTWSGTPPAARVGLFRSLHPRSGRCVKSSSDSFTVHHMWQTTLHNLPRSGCYDDFQRTIFGKHVRIQRFSDARKKVPSLHKRPGKLLCTYIRILWLKRCVQFAAGHPLLLRLTRRSHPAIWSSPARVIHLDVSQQESQHRLRQKLHL